MLIKIPEQVSSTKIHPLVGKIAEELQVTGEMSKL